LHGIGPVAAPVGARVVLARGLVAALAGVVGDQGSGHQQCGGQQCDQQRLRIHGDSSRVGGLSAAGQGPGGRFEPSHGGAPAPLSISPRRGHRRRPAPIPSDTQGICGPGRQSLYTRPTTINNNSTTKEYLPMSRLANKVAVVAGGATGIGAACAIRYAAEGAKVVIGDFNIDTARELAESIGPNAIAVRYDAADADSIKALIDSAVETFGTLNVLHNNVAITSLAIQSQDTTVVDIPLEIWNATLNINVTSFLLGSKYAIPHMI